MMRLEEQGYRLPSGNERRIQAGQSATVGGGRRISLNDSYIGVCGHLVGTEEVPSAQIAEALNKGIGFPVTVDSNVRCFTADIINRDALLADLNASDNGNQAIEQRLREASTMRATAYSIRPVKQRRGRLLRIRLQNLLRRTRRGSLFRRHGATGSRGICTLIATPTSFPPISKEMPNS